MTNETATPKEVIEAAESEIPTIKETTETQKQEMSKEQKAEERVEPFDLGEQEEGQMVDVPGLGKGEIKVHKRKNNSLSAEHKVANFKGKGKAGTDYEMELSGTVRDEKTNSSEEYKYDYVQITDERGKTQIKTSKLESNFSNGDKEVLQNSFDKKGRAISKEATLNGQLRSKVKNVYDEKDRLIMSKAIDYDDAGNEAGSFEAIFKPEQQMVVTHTLKKGEQPMSKQFNERSGIDENQITTKNSLVGAGRML